MSRLGEAAQEYLSTRRRLGFKLARQGQLLADFVGYCQQRHLETITVQVAVDWATAPAGADPNWWGARLSVVRCFARWQAAFDPNTQVPPADAVPAHSHRADPFPYTEGDIADLMRAAGQLRSPLRAATYQT